MERCAINFIARHWWRRFEVWVIAPRSRWWRRHLRLPGRVLVSGQKQSNQVTNIRKAYDTAMDNVTSASKS